MSYLMRMHSDWVRTVLPVCARDFGYNISVDIILIDIFFQCYSLSKLNEFFGRVVKLPDISRMHISVPCGNRYPRKDCLIR